MIKDAADLFAAEGEDAKEILEDLKKEAKDALDLLLSEAPESSQRERFHYAREQLFPLLTRIEDKGERGAALDDVAGRLGLRKTDLRKAFGEFEEQAQRGQETSQEGTEEAQEDLAPEPGTESYERAMELLRCPDILESVVQDLEHLGHVGESVPKQLAFICANSAQAGNPIQPSTHAESSAGKNYLWDTVLDFLPPEKVIRRSAISGKVLFRTNMDLKGAVLYIQEVPGSEDADYPIRILQSDNKLVYEVTEKMPDGFFTTVVYVKEGPTVVVQTTTQDHLHTENETRVFPIYLDESEEQTKRITDRAKEEAETGGIPPEERQAILERWQDAMRLLQPAQVIIPCARRIQMPNRLVRMRRDVHRVFNVIRMIAWLSQYNRERDEQGRILATEDDFHKALGLVSDSLTRAWKSLNPTEEKALQEIKKLSEAKRKNGFHRSELSVPDVSSRRLQEVLKSLSRSGHLNSDGRRGPQGYKYTMPDSPEEGSLGISLRSPGDEGTDGDNDDPEDPDAEEDPARGRNIGEEEGEVSVSRDIARYGDRAIKGPLSTGEGAIARGRCGGSFRGPRT